MRMLVLRWAAAAALPAWLSPAKAWSSASAVAASLQSAARPLVDQGHKTPQKIACKNCKSPPRNPFSWPAPQATQLRAGHGLGDPDLARQVQALEEGLQRLGAPAREVVHLARASSGTMQNKTLLHLLGTEPSKGLPWIKRNSQGELVTPQSI